MPLNIDIQQICLHLFNVTILFAALYFLLYQPVKNFMAQRARRYEDLDRQTKEKLAEAEQLKAQYQQKLAEADQEIQARTDQALQTAMESTQRQLQQAKEEAEHILTKARAETQAEREQMLMEARSEITELITTAAEKLILKDTSEAYDRFLDAAGEDAHG